MLFHVDQRKEDIQGCQLDILRPPTLFSFIFCINFSQSDLILKKLVQNFELKRVRGARKDNQFAPIRISTREWLVLGFEMENNDRKKMCEMIFFSSFPLIWRCIAGLLGRPNYCRHVHVPP